MSLIERMKSAPVRRIERVPGTSLGDDVYVRELTGREFDDAVRDNKNEDDSMGRVEFVGLALCDKDGNAEIDLGNPEHRTLLGSLGNATLTALFKAAQKINGIDNPQKGEE